MAVQEEDEYNNIAYAYDSNGNRICMIYDHNDFFTVFVQILLAAFALGSLYIKRMQEVPRRKFSTWARDVSKQGVGACYAHLANMVIAAILSQNIAGGGQEGGATHILEDQCAWYGISYLIDTTLGLVLAILFIRMQDEMAHKFNWEGLKHHGVYQGEDANRQWIAQTMAWLFILTIVKILIYIFMLLASDPLAWMGLILFEPLQVNIRFELLFVMIFFPGFLNVIYFWIADSYLKANKDSLESGEAFEDDDHHDNKQSKKEALLTDSEKELATFHNRSSPSPSPSTQQQQQQTSNQQTGGTFGGITSNIPSWSVFSNAGANITSLWGQQQQQQQQSSFSEESATTTQPTLVGRTYQLQASV